MNVFAVTFDQFNAFLLYKSIVFPTPGFLNGSVSTQILPTLMIILDDKRSLIPRRHITDVLGRLLTIRQHPPF